jgi:hypothetical protein
LAGSVTAKKFALSMNRPGRLSRFSRNAKSLCMSRFRKPFFLPDRSASIACGESPMAMNCQKIGSNALYFSCSTVTDSSKVAPSVTNMTYTGWLSRIGWLRGPGMPQ